MKLSNKSSIVHIIEQMNCNELLARPNKNMLLQRLTSNPVVNVVVVVLDLS